MQVQTLPLSQLIVDENNLRVHKSRNAILIRDSLLKHKQYLPLVVQKSTNKIVVGNGRFLVMKDLNWTECDCVVLDLTDEQVKRLSIIDNRSSDLADWDRERLKDVMTELQSYGIEMDGMGFTDRELKAMFCTIEEPDEKPESKEPKEKKHQCPKCGKVWSEQKSVQE